MIRKKLQGAQLTFTQGKELVRNFYHSQKQVQA